MSHIITGTWPIEFPLKVFIFCYFFGLKFLLTQEPFLKKLINQEIFEIHTYRGYGRPIKCCIVSYCSIFGAAFNRVWNKLKQTYDARVFFVQPEKCAHVILGTAGGNCIKVLSVDMQSYCDLIQKTSLWYPII